MEIYEKRMEFSLPRKQGISQSWQNSLVIITERWGKSVPHHNALMVFDAEAIPMSEYLENEESKVYRSALGICLYLAQERLDIQQTVRVLSSYMGQPTKTALCALRKL